MSLTDPTAALMGPRSGRSGRGEGSEGGAGSPCRPTIARDAAGASPVRWGSSVGAPPPGRVGQVPSGPEECALPAPAATGTSLAFVHSAAECLWERQFGKLPTYDTGCGIHSLPLALVNVHTYGCISVHLSYLCREILVSEFPKQHRLTDIPRSTPTSPPFISKEPKQ